MYNVPVLFLIFNRPDTTRQVFERIRQIKPAKLYVAADAPREGLEKEYAACMEAREITAQIDWDCELKTLFREKNLGCKSAVSGAITWFFDREEFGIILEDDCLPDLSFFPFCEELLVRYRNDERIGHISGNCFLSDAVDKNYSYNFSSVTHIWGWATWKRAWQNVNVNFPCWNSASRKERSDMFINKREEIYFSTFIPDALTKRNNLNPWGVFYYFSLRLQNQLSIYPSVNMVTNIGLNSEEATHTKKSSKKQLIPLSSISFPLKHPQYVLRNRKLDDESIRRLFFSWKRLIRFFLNLFFN